eukprot:gene6956-14117_t
MNNQRPLTSGGVIVSQQVEDFHAVSRLPDLSRAQKLGSIRNTTIGRYQDVSNLSKSSSQGQDSLSPLKRHDSLRGKALGPILGTSGRTSFQLDPTQENKALLQSHEIKNDNFSHEAIVGYTGHQKIHEDGDDDDNKDRVPIVGYSGWYAGKIKGKIGRSDLHRAPLARSDSNLSKLMIAPVAKTHLSPKSGGRDYKQRFNAYHEAEDQLNSRHINLDKLLLEIQKRLDERYLSTAEKHIHIKQQFQSADNQKTGFVCTDEFLAILIRLNIVLPWAELYGLLKRLDPDISELKAQLTTVINIYNNDQNLTFNNQLPALQTIADFYSNLLNDAFKRSNITRTQTRNIQQDTNNLYHFNNLVYRMYFSDHCCSSSSTVYLSQSMKTNQLHKQPFCVTSQQQ